MCWERQKTGVTGSLAYLISDDYNGEAELVLEWKVKMCRIVLDAEYERVPRSLTLSESLDTEDIYCQ